MIPLYGFVKGDTIGLLMLADPNEKIIELGKRLQNAASVRVPPRKNFAVIYNENTLDPDLTVGEAGFEMLDRFDLV